MIRPWFTVGDDARSAWHREMPETECRRHKPGDTHGEGTDMTRTGRIARLPAKIREELNGRGSKTAKKTLIKWPNHMSEEAAFLDKHYENPGIALWPIMGGALAIMACWGCCP
jgi:hypothetical protein